MTRESPVDARCWAGFSERMLGVGPNRDRSVVEVPASAWPKVASIGDVLAVLREDRLELRDGRSGDLRIDLSAPFASGVIASGRRFWLDEDGSARPVSVDGQPGDPVDLRGARGLVAVSERWLAARVSGAFDNSMIKVVATRAAKGVAFATPSLANPTVAAFTDGGLVVAHDGGIQQWDLDGQSSRVVHKAPVRLGLVTILPTDVRPDPAADADWYLICEDVLSETRTATGKTQGAFKEVRVTATTESRLVRFRGGEPETEWVFDGRALGLAFASEHLWVLTTKTKSIDPYAAAGPVECRILNDRMEAIDVVDFGNEDWRGGFAVCAGQPI